MIPNYSQKPLPQQPSTALNKPSNETSIQQLAIQQPIEQQMSNLRLADNQQRPRHSKRVYAPMPSPALQQQQQQPFPPPPQQQQQHLSYTGLPPRPKPRIDPDTLPSPIANQSKDEAYYSTNFYGTCGDNLPLASTDFCAIDQGNCNPRFMRSTITPTTGDLPSGLVAQPLAHLHPQDMAIPVIHANPARCQRCKGYLNAWCQISTGWNCNLCGMEKNELKGVEGPEVELGTVEYEVSDEYNWKEQPNEPMRWLWVVDVSRSGLDALKRFCETTKKLLKEGRLEGILVGLVTYDTTLHFYNMRDKVTKMMVVSDLKDVFIPLHDLFVDPIESRSTIEMLLDQLLKFHEYTSIPYAAFGSAIQASFEALKLFGGKVSIIQSTMPSVGPYGILKSRDDPKLYGTEQEKGLLAPHDKFYTHLSQQLAEAGISVDLWICNYNDVDLATTSVLSQLTAGDVHYVDDQFDVNWTHTIEREQGYRATLRVRCSNGLTVTEHYGNFYMTNSTDIELANVNSNTTLGFALKCDSKEVKDTYVQMALLYTTRFGHRRIRVHNLKLMSTTTTAINSIYRSADLDTIMNFMTKQLIAKARNKTLNDLSNWLDDWCVKILFGYRQKCAPQASPAQLILPDSLRNLPLLVNSLKKSILLRKDSNINLDKRVYHLRKIMSLSIMETILWLYPRCIAIHESMTLVRASYDRLDPKGVYWIQSLDYIFLWIGSENPTPAESILHDERVQVLYEKAKLHITAYLPKLQVVRQGIDSEVEVANCLVEDEIFGQMSYVDYMCMIHKHIQLELEREKQDTIISAASYWTHRY